MSLWSSLQPHMLIHASPHSCPTIGVIASHYVVMATPTAIWGAGRWQGKQMSGQSGFPGKSHNDTLLIPSAGATRTAGRRPDGGPGNGHGEGRALQRPRHAESVFTRVC